MVALPSIDPTREGFGIVLLEAMACGRPVISTNITGVAEDIRKCRGGLVIEPGNVMDLSEAIKTILHDLNLAVQMGCAGRALVEQKYGSGIVADQIEQLYYDAVLLKKQN